MTTSFQMYSINCCGNTLTIVDSDGKVVDEKEWNRIKTVVNKSYKSKLVSSDANSQSIAIVETKGVKKTKRDIVNEKANDPEFIKFFQDLRNKYTLYSKNKYLKHFGLHQQQFYKTLAYRVAKDDTTKEHVDYAFSLMTAETNFSIMDFLIALGGKYSDYERLVDFVWIMQDGKISAPLAERKGAKELIEWIEDGKATLTEIEDCFLWIPNSGRSYNLSLISMKAALATFDRVKFKNQDGRFEGKSINNFKSKDEKTVEVLEQRDYDTGAEQILAASKAQKDYLQQLSGK